MPQPRPAYRGKRIFDLLIVALASVPATLVGSVCAVAVKCTSKGPVFFVQERVGLHERAFRIIKFRTMVAAPDNPIFPSDKHITAAGRWLRRWSLDELPQLINVALGDMSIVGPRPTLAYQVERYDAQQRRRLLVKPGLTGLAQIAGRNSISWTERINYDLEYIDRQSLKLDAWILLKTVSTLVHGSGIEGHPPEDPLAA